MLHYKLKLNNAYCSRWQLSTTPQGVLNTVSIKLLTTVKPRFNEVGGDGPNMFVKWRVSYIENLDITNLRGNDQNVRYIEVIVND